MRQKLYRSHGRRISWPLNPRARPPANAVARSVERIAVMAVTETDSVTSFPNKLFRNFGREADRTGVSELEALTIGIFERGLTPGLHER